MRLTPELERLLNEAVKLAGDQHHEYVSLEHIVLAMTEDKEAKAIIQGCGGDVEALKSDVQQFISKHCPKLETKALTELGSSEWKPALTLAFQRVVQRALFQVQSSEKEIVGTGNLLISLLKEEESPAVIFLQNQGVTHFGAINYFSHALGHTEGTSPEVGPESIPEMPGGIPRRPRPRPWSPIR